jgi:hypothetical protein
LRTLLAVRFASLGYQPRLFNCAIDFRVLSDGNQPRATLPGEHKQEHPPPWVLCSGIAQQLPVHVSDGDVAAQEANINLVELRRTVLEDSVIRPISFGDFWRMSLPKASISWRFQLVANPATALRTWSASFGAAGTRLSSRHVKTATAARIQKNK